MRERDNQRQRLYDAEGQALRGHGERYAELSDAQVYVNKVLASAWVQTRWGRRNVTVNRGRGDGGHSYGGWITVGRDAQQWVVLHELAHELAPANVVHGPVFAAIYLALVTRFMGAEHGARLRAAFRQHRVKHRSPGAVPARVAMWW